ncbi:sulfite exporter TauE/SafE family protein [Amaricoccus macauensis]|uniref:sulfite exporter TauE/SafE family protein n=1 Tax=Amaricoccus macauensis TaxID=57001 RepID=UPI003C7ECB1B
MEFNLYFWIAATIAAFIVGLSKGGLAIAGPLVVPILSTVMPPTLAAGLMLPIYLISDSYAVWLFRRNFSKRNLAILIPAGLIGVILGYLMVERVSEDVIKLLVAGVGLWYLADVLIKRMRKTPLPPRPADVPRGLFWGALSGLTSYVSHSGGPPFQAYVLPQKLDKLVFVGTSTLFFAIVNLAKLPTYIMAGQLRLEAAWVMALLAVVALGGARTGYWLTHVLPERIFYIFVEIALFLISMKLIYEVVFSG